MQHPPQPWCLRIIMALATPPLLIGILICLNAWSTRTQANSLYQYPYAEISAQQGNRALYQELNFYQDRIRRNPDDGLDRAALATVYLKLARSTGNAQWYLKAEHMAQQSLVNLPFNNAEATLILARVAEAQHDFKTTVQLVNQILQDKPGNTEALALTVTTHLALGQLQTAQQAAQTLVEQMPTLNTLTLQALVQVAQGQDEQALHSFQQALAAEEPGETASSAKTRVFLGRLHAQRGRHTLAQTLYQEALRIQPQLGLAKVHWAQLATQRGEDELAERLYTELLDHPDSTQVYDHVALQGLAHLKQLQGDRAAAQRLWQTAQIQFEHHQGSDTDHHHHHQPAHTHTQTSTNAPHLHREHPPHQGAKDTHTTAAEQQTFGHRRELARLLLARGQAADGVTALTLMQAEVEIRRDADTLDTFAWALMNQGKFADAQVVLKEALALGTRDAKIQYRAGLAAQSLGNDGQAQQHFQTAQQIDPTFNERTRQLWGLNQGSVD